MAGELLVVREDALVFTIANEFHAIKGALDGAGLDFAAGTHVGAYVDDEGLYNALPLNVIASLFVHRSLYGPAVMCSPLPDNHGNNVPLDDHTARAIMAAAAAWRAVIDYAAMAGQDITVYSNPDTVASPVFIPLPNGWMPGDPIPTREEQP